MSVHFTGLTTNFTRTASLPTLSAYTIMMWVYYDGIDDGQALYPFIFTDAGSGQFNGILQSNGTSLTVCGVNDSAQGTFSSSAAGGRIVSRRAFHYAVTCRAFSTAGATKCVIDGIDLVLGAKTTSLTPTTLKLAQTTASMAMEDVRIWKRFMAVNEIQQEMLSPVPVNLGKLQSWYPLRTVTDGVNDVVGGLPLTLNGAMTNFPSFARWNPQRERSLVKLGSGIVISGAAAHPHGVTMMGIG